MRGAERKCGIPAFNCLPIGSQRHYSAGWINSQGPLVIFHRRVKRAGIVCQARPGIIMQGLLLTPFQAGTSRNRSEEHTSELQSLMRISYDVFCLKKKNKITYKKVNNSLYYIYSIPIHKY